jgi:hypothetical protein
VPRVGTNKTPSVMSAGPAFGVRRGRQGRSTGWTVTRHERRRSSPARRIDPRAGGRARHGREGA